ncbi:MAG: hypothetical protein FJ150_04795 [Euryarchaeota archaeon]|nr:hypothetical protein [Euryarchaeota archaeon]
MYKLNLKIAFLIYVIIDVLCVGMGVPFFCILLGFPVGWYIAKRITTDKKVNSNLTEILTEIFRYAVLTSLFTFILMLVIWGSVATMLLDPKADFINFGIPMILYDPKFGFIGWLGLMIFISPFLQFLMTIFASYLGLMKWSKS